MDSLSLIPMTSPARKAGTLSILERVMDSLSLILITHTTKMEQIESLLPMGTE